MAETKDEPNFVTGTYSIPPEWKDRIEQEAKEQDLNTSQYMRRILAYFWASKAAKRAATPEPAPVELA